MHNGGIFGTELHEDIKHESKFKVCLENLPQYKNIKDWREFVTKRLTKGAHISLWLRWVVSGPAPLPSMKMQNQD